MIHLSSPNSLQNIASQTLELIIHNAIGAKHGVISIIKLKVKPAVFAPSVYCVSESRDLGTGLEILAVIWAA